MPNSNKGRRWPSAYSESSAKNLQLPQRMKCYRCGKNKDSATNFSKKEQDRARDALRYTGVLPTDLKCIPCTGGQNTEMKCIMCEQVMGLDMFAKTHRSNPENAKCKSCMQDQLDWDPTEYEPDKKKDSDYEDDDEGSEDDDDSDGDTEYSSSRRTKRSKGRCVPTISSLDDDDTSTDIASLSINDSTASTAIKSQPTSNFMSSELFTSSGSGGVHLPGSSVVSAATSEADGWETVGSSRRRVPASSASVSSTGARAGSTATPTKFNPNAYGNPLHSNPASRSGSVTPSNKTSAWAKPKNNYKSSRPRASASANDDEDDEAPAVSAAPTDAWESDSDDDDDDD